jgi:hypothetical protein
VGKPGSPSELAHYGVKGQKWGVRKARSPSEAVSSKKSTSKQVGKAAAKGIGYATILAGSLFVAHQLTKSGNIPVSHLSDAAITAAGKATQEAFLAAVRPELHPR